jgi:hypothetical protein
MTGVEQGEMALSTLSGPPIPASSFPDSGIRPFARASPQQELPSLKEPG